MNEHRRGRATGGCLCGAVRYEVVGPLRDVVMCHCSRCRRTHGHAAAYSACARSDLVLVRDDGLRWYESDDRARGFCGECGASLFWRAEGRATVSIAAGTLDQPTGLKTVAHIYTRDLADYYEICGDAERFAGSQSEIANASRSTPGSGDQSRSGTRRNPRRS